MLSGSAPLSSSESSDAHKENKPKNWSYRQIALIVINALATATSLAAIITDPNARKQAEVYVDFLTHLCTTLTLSGFTNNKALPLILNALRELQILSKTYQGLSFFPTGANIVDAVAHGANICALTQSNEQKPKPF